MLWGGSLWMSDTVTVKTSQEKCAEKGGYYTLQTTPGQPICRLPVESFAMPSPGGSGGIHLPQKGQGAERGGNMACDGGIQKHAGLGKQGVRELHPTETAG